MPEKITNIIILLLFPTLSLSAKSVSIGTARIVAQNWYDHHSNETGVAGKIREIYIIQSDNHNCFYRFTFEKGGWVIVSADAAVYPILAYSLTSSYSKQEIHPALSCLLDKYKAFVDHIITTGSETQEANQSWEKFLQNDFHGCKNTDQVEALLKTQWHQTYPYNLYCPLDHGSPSVAGCGATAMAQVIKYYSYPPKGQGSVSYNSLVTTPPANLTVHFDSTYFWRNMPNTLVGATSEQIKEVARLIYHVGVSVQMNYTRIGSGNALVGIPAILSQYFKYAKTAMMEEKYSYSGNWDDLLKTELNNKRPILYFGIEDPTWAGYHAFVIDGYDNTGKYHINWGWNGYGDGYYTLTGLQVDNMDFTKDQTAIVGIAPASALACEITQPENNSVFTVGQNITIQAIASDTEPITKAQLFVDEALIHTSTNLPYNFDWKTNGVALGSRVVKIKVTNSKGLTRTAIANISLVNDPNSMLLFEENFDGETFPPENWERIANSLSYNWVRRNPQDFAFAPDFNMHNPNSTASALCNYYWTDQDEWLISPEINTNEIASMYLTFFAAFGRFYFDFFSLKLYISTDYGLSWTQLWSAKDDTYPTDFWKWRSVAIDLSHYAGQKIKLAWQCTGSSRSVDGDLAGLDDVKLISGSLTNVKLPPSQLPEKVILYQNYPNPFNSATMISYSLKSGFDDKVTLSIYNVRGMLVINLLDIRQKAGTYTIKLDGHELTSGIYFVKLSSKDIFEVKKITLIN